MQSTHIHRANQPPTHRRPRTALPLHTEKDFVQFIKKFNVSKNLKQNFFKNKWTNSIVTNNADRNTILLVFK